MNSYQILAVIGIATIIIYFIWNARTLYILRRRNLNNKDVLFDNEKYFELKYKSEFLIASFTIAATAFGFIGYNSIENISNEVKKEANLKIDKLDSSIDVLEQKGKDVSAQLIGADSVAKTAKEKSEKSSRDLKSLSDNIASINSKNKLKENFYVVNNQFFNRLKDDYMKKIYYNDLITSSGDKLPAFKTPPSISVSSFNNTGFTAVNVTTEYFYVRPIDGDYQADVKDTFYFALVFFP